MPGRGNKRKKQRAAKAAAAAEAAAAAGAGAGGAKGGGAGAAAAAAAGAAKPVEAGMRKKLGDAAFLAKKYEDAVKEYSAAVGEAKDDTEKGAILSNRANANLHLDRFGDALRDAEQAIRLRPDWSKGYLRAGVALRSLRRTGEALKMLEKALEIEPTLAPAQRAIADTKELDKDLAEEEKQSEPTTAAMVKWLVDGGAEFPSMKIQQLAPEYRLVRALRPISPQRTILYVPLSHIMTTGKAKQSPIGKKIADLVDKGVLHLQSTHTYLAVYLMQEKHNEQSMFRPYLECLPQDFHNVPINFGEEELKMLDGSFVKPKIIERREKLRTEFENVRKFVPEMDQFKLAEFVWARLVVITRVFGFKVKEDKTEGLVPYADMLNHKHPKHRETSWTYDDTRAGFTITAETHMAPGDEVFDSYGRKCNSRFFVNYGFTIEDNEDDEAVFRVSLPAVAEYFDKKRTLLRGNLNHEFQTPANYGADKTRKLFAFCRFLHLSGRELAMMPGDRDEIDKAFVQPVSVANETKVLEQLHRYCVMMLKQFSTTIEEDKKRIQELPRFSAARNCVVMLLSEKRVLQWYIELAETALPVLKGGNNKRGMKRSKKFDAYMKEISRL